MNVFSSVKNAFTHIPHFLRDSSAPEPWESETHLVKRDILRLAHTFIGDGSMLQLKEDALRDIGHIVFMGGPDAVKTVLSIVPHMLVTLTNEETPTTMRLQVLRTLSEICHRSRLAQEKVFWNKAAKGVIIGMIADVSRVHMSRWACYTLIMLVNDNPTLLRELKDYPAIEEILDSAMDFPLPWMAWGCNLAELLLKILGFILI